MISFAVGAVEGRGEAYVERPVSRFVNGRSAVAGVFGEHNVSIRSMEQEGLGEEARLVFITHRARERDMQATLHGLRRLDVVDRIGTLSRVVGGQ